MLPLRWLLFLIAICSSPVKAEVIMLRYGPDAYIRVGGYAEGLDKVWRVRIGAPPKPGASGVIDFYGERAILSTTPAKLTGSAFYRSLAVLRTGGEEAAPAFINGVRVGGNHLVEGRNIRDYVKQVSVDGVPRNGDGIVTGSSIVLTESYNIGSEAHLDIEYRFSQAEMYCHFRYKITVFSPARLDLAGAVQAQRLPVREGETLHLVVPGATIPGGDDITTNRLISLTPNTWIEGPPRKFSVVVMRDNIPQHAYTVAYDNDAAGPLSTAMELSTKGKLYPYAIEPQASGEFTISGYFGVHATP